MPMPMPVSSVPRVTVHTLKSKKLIKTYKPKKLKTLGIYQPCSIAEQVNQSSTSCFERIEPTIKQCT